MANFEGEHLLFETDRLSPSYGFVFFYSPTSDTISYYDSLETMLKTLIQLFINKALVYNAKSKY